MTVPTMPPLTPASVPPLPIPGNVQNQLSQGQSLVAKLKNPTGANLTDLLGAGVTMIGSMVGGTGQTLIRSVVSIGTAVASGAAVGGPFGAAAGALIGGAEAIAQLFQNGPPVYAGFELDSTAGSERLAALVEGWQSINTGLVSNNAQGQSFVEYLFTKFSPAQTQRPKLLWYLVNNSDGIGSASDPRLPPLGMEDLTHRGGVSWPLSASDVANAKRYLTIVQTIDDAVFWGWPAPGAGATSTADYASSFKQVSAQGSYELWKEDTKPVTGAKGLTVDEIMASALRRAPDPMYFAMDLYVAASDVSDGSTYTLILNTAALSGVATVLGLLAVGASTRAIVSELMLQQHILYLLDYSAGPTDPVGTVTQLESDLSPANLQAAADAGHPYSQAQIAAMKLALAAAKSRKTPPPIPDLFRQLVEDYVALAHAEAKDPRATMASVVNAAKNVLDLPKILVGPPSDVMSAADAAKTVQKYVTKYLGHG